MHPTIERGTPEYLEWKAYFERHLGGLPFVFRRLMQGEQQSMTMPEQHPQWFDPSWQPGGLGL